MSKLPDKLSELIRVAIADLEKCEAMPEVYQIDMDDWHFHDKGVCRVCLAGATIAQSIKADPHDSMAPFDVGIPPDDNKKLMALDSCRRSRWENASWQMGVGFALSKMPTVTPYDANPDQFKADLLQAADILEVAGL